MKANSEPSGTEATSDNRGPEYELIAEAIRHRDGHSCQRCGLDEHDHRTKLHVHHITRASEAPPERVHDDQNLITVCHACHRRLDSKCMTVERQLEELGFESREDIPRLPRLPDDLREVDEKVLEYLTAGRVTPAYARARLVEDGMREYSRGYVQQRLGRLEEHSHAENLMDTGLYELRSDPREVEK